MTASSNTTMATSTSLGKGFMDLPGELRNETYHLFFESILADSTPAVRTGNLPINHTDIQYASANTFDPIIALFRTSQAISTEARTLFYAIYFPRRHYLLQSRESICSFSRIPRHWAQNIHQIQLTAHGITQARRVFNPIKVAIVKAARADASGSTTCLDALHLQLADGNSPWLSTTIRRRFTADLKLDGIPTTLRVYKCNNDRFDILITGPLSKLDWTMIPLTRYTEDSAWEQLLARRARLLRDDVPEAPMRQMPVVTEFEDSEPYVEEQNAGSVLLAGLALEIVQALGLELPKPKTDTWELSFK
jgi:hypothetical protein